MSRRSVNRNRQLIAEVNRALLQPLDKAPRRQRKAKPSKFARSLRRGGAGGFTYS